MDWEELEKKYGVKPTEKPPEKKKDRRLLIFALIFGIVGGTIAIIVIVGMFFLTGSNTLQLKKGFRYEYPMITAYSSSAIEIYGTKEEGNSWEGIVAVKDDNEMIVMLGRFRIDEDLNLFLSNPLSKEEVLDENIDLYRINELEDPSMSMSLIPFSMLMYKDVEYAGFDIEELIAKKTMTISEETLTLTGPVEHNGYLSYEVIMSSSYGSDSTIYIGTVRPYMLIEASSYGTIYNISKVEQKEFDLADYEGYDAYEGYIPYYSTEEPEDACSPCFGTQFAYVDYYSDMLILMTGSRTIKNLELFAEPSAPLTLSWVNGTSTDINPGSTLTISGFEIGETYTLTLEYIDVNSELSHQEFAVLSA